MFNLEQAISDWRQQMLAAGIKSPVPLEELESHLREVIERQMRAGCDAALAFEMAVAQIGKGIELHTEFSRMNRWRSILEFELIRKDLELKWGPVFSAASFAAVLLFFCDSVLFKFGAASAMTSAEQMSSLAAAVVSSLLLGGGLFCSQFFPVIGSERKRLVVCLCLGAPTVIWLMIFLLRVNVGLAQFFTEFSWAFFVPFGALCGVILGLERAAGKKSPNALAK
jgi:hypothetical protein